jgi:hypothetical protein
MISVVTKPVIVRTLIETTLVTIVNIPATIASVVAALKTRVAVPSSMIVCAALTRPKHPVIEDVVPIVMPVMSASIFSRSSTRRTTWVCGRLHFLPLKGGIIVFDVSSARDLLLGAITTLSR